MMDQAHSKLGKIGTPDGENNLNSIVLNSMASLLIVLDREGRIILFNRACENLTGYAFEEVQNKCFWEFLLLPEDIKFIIELFEDLRAGHFPNTHENYWLTKSGERRLIAWSNTAVVNRENKVEYIVGTGVDITDRRLTDERLRLLESAVEQSNDAILITTAELDLPGPQIVFANHAFLRMTGYALEEVINRTPRFLQGTQTDHTVLDELRENLKKGESFRGTTINYRKNGEAYNVEWSVAPITDADGKTVYYIAIQQDVTDRHRTQQAIRNARDYYNQIINAVADPIFVKNRRHEWTLVNDAMCELMGHPREQLIGKSDYDFVPSSEADVFWRKDEEIFNSKKENVNEEQLTDANGIVRIVQTRKKFYADENGEELIVAVMRDITERKQLEQQLLHNAFHDGLTGLANRTLFIDHLGKAIERVKRDSREMLAVLFLDFDRFKVVNDSLGHNAGDYLLAQIARRLASSLRSGDLVARMGGDEFAVLLNKIENSSVAVQVAERLQRNLETPFEIGGSGKISISASIGIVLSTTGYEKAEDMLRDADIAMYSAKAAGKARCQVFDRTMHEQASRRLHLEIEMRQALEREEFLLHYQPIIELETRRLVGFEALVRWRHPELGMIPPLEFIPAAEENNLILPLGKWILHESCRQLRAWQETIDHAAELTISVNLSGKQFSQPYLADQVKAALEETRLDPAGLKLEITESQLMENSDTAIKTISSLRALGIALSVDDFGTGYSSLSYLHRLPVSYLKIDRSFVNGIIEKEENAEIVRTIVELAHNLKMQVIAEGIETKEQTEWLKKLKCEYGQGFLFSKPLAAEEAKDFIRINLVPNHR